MKLRSVQHNAAPVNADSIATPAFSVTACAIRDFMRSRRNHKPVGVGGFGYFGFHAIEKCPLFRARIPNLATGFLAAK
jgi:hypothetical protein